MKVTVYSSTGCEPCTLVKDALASNGIDFVERAVEEPGVWAEADQYLPPGQRFVPVTVIEHADGKTTVLTGWRTNYIDLIQQTREG